MELRSQSPSRRRSYYITLREVLLTEGKDSSILRRITMMKEHLKQGWSNPQGHLAFNKRLYQSQENSQLEEESLQNPHAQPINSIKILSNFLCWFLNVSKLKWLQKNSASPNQTNFGTKWRGGSFRSPQSWENMPNIMRFPSNLLQMKTSPWKSLLWKKIIERPLQNLVEYLQNQQGSA